MGRPRWIVDVKDKGGAHVHGAVFDNDHVKGNAHVNGNVVFTFHVG
jgi:hypothetical protein